MPKKDIFLNPYKPGDENSPYYNDPKILKTFISSLSLVDAYFRYSVVGLDKIPRTGPALIVANHGFMPIDMLLLARTIYQVRGRRMRSLAHRRSWRIPVLREVALNIGVVNATPENANKLLRSGEIVAVFPGGEAEGLRPSSKKYKLLWEDRMGFARTAVEAQIPVIPAMCVGIDDIFHVFGKNEFKPFKFTRFFPIPFFLGLGGLPFPRKLTHFIGKPIIPPKYKNAKEKQKAIRYVHAKALKDSQALLKMGQRHRKWFSMTPERALKLVEKTLKNLSRSKK